jgi:hypothetical protein
MLCDSQAYGVEEVAGANTTTWRLWVRVCWTCEVQNLQDCSVLGCGTGDGQAQETDYNTVAAPTEAAAESSANAAMDLRLQNEQQLNTLGCNTQIGEHVQECGRDVVTTFTGSQYLSKYVQCLRCGIWENLNPDPTYCTAANPGVFCTGTSESDYKILTGFGISADFTVAVDKARADLQTKLGYNYFECGGQRIICGNEYGDVPEGADNYTVLANGIYYSHVSQCTACR